MTQPSLPTATSPAGELVHAPEPADAPWWRDPVIYQVYPRSWVDSDGDGVGDLPGITSKLPYLRDLGVDAVWLSPFYVSPMNDAGYDVADYRDVDPIFGTLADADRLVATAHDLGLKVLVDLVPNHSSSEHEWFRAALAAAPGSRERARYLFRDGSGEHGEEPPNNWRSTFGGQGWSRVPEADGRPGQWYLHLFDSTQPDFDWSNPEVREEFHAILRFWLDRGVDGFRVDVAHGLVKDPALPDWEGSLHLLGGDADGDGEAEQGTDGDPLDTGAEHQRPPMWDQDGVHEVYRGWRRVVDEYSGSEAEDRILCAEAWVQPEERLARYVRRDEMHQAFNFEFLQTRWDAQALRRAAEQSYRAADEVGAPTTWVLSNHDVVRHASRLGVRQQRPVHYGIGPQDEQPDAVLGLRRARAATTVMLALPGGAYLYQGEELGLPEATMLPDEVRQDPRFRRTGGEDIGRDGCRVPVPWEKSAPAFGFSPTGSSWLPQPEAYGDLAPDQQQGVTGSTLELYRTLLATRRRLRLGRGGLRWHELAGPTVLAFVVTPGAGAEAPAAEAGPVLVVLNLGPDAVPLPAGATVILASGPLQSRTVLSDTSVPSVPGVPTDTALWARLDS